MKVIPVKKRYLPWLKAMAKKTHDICGVDYQILLQYIVAIFSVLAAIGVLPWRLKWGPILKIDTALPWQ